jgi:hypothetical protein
LTVTARTHPEIFQKRAKVPPKKMELRIIGIPDCDDATENKNYFGLV